MTEPTGFGVTTTVANPEWPWALAATCNFPTATPVTTPPCVTVSLATVTQGGVVTGVAVGKLQVAASAQGPSGFATVVVTPKPVGSVIVTPAHATIRVATTLQLSDTVKDQSGNVLTGQTVTWSTDSANTASVDGNGLVTGRHIGTATITATVGGK